MERKGKFYKDYKKQSIAEFSGQIAYVESKMELSTRELEIIIQIANGLSDKEIAQKLKISTRTIQTHVTRLCLKLSARNRTHAVAKLFLKAIKY